MGDRTKRRINGKLTEFSKFLVIDPELMAHDRAVTDEIARLLRSYSPYRIDRIINGGSYGKKTGTCIKLDVDLVVYVNNGGSFETKHILEHWKQILISNTDLQEADFGGKMAMGFVYKGKYS